MGKQQKYTEEQLLEAVIRYSEFEPGKIKVAALAEWSRNNIEGLEEVQNFHFVRPITEIEPKTKKKVERQKLSAARIEEINNARSITMGVNANILLRASNIDAFLQLPNVTQRKLVVETRETVDKLLQKNTNMAKEIRVLRHENQRLKSDVEVLTDQTKELGRKQALLIQQVRFLLKKIDEAEQKAILSQMGITDGEINLNEYVESLSLEIDQVMRISQILHNNVDVNEKKLQDESENETSNMLLMKVLSGIDMP